MKFLTIIQLIFLINVSAALINAIDITSSYEVQPSQGWLDDTKNDIEGDEYFQSSAVQDSSNNFGFGDFVKGLWIFIRTFVSGIVAVPYMLKQFGMDSGLAVTASLPIYLTYGLGIAQMISNRSTKSMD